MKELKEQLLTNWHFMRFVRLGLGIYLGVEAILMRDPLSGLISVFFLYQTFTNTGCCGASACETRTPINTKEEAEVVQFEEIKTK